MIRSLLLAAAIGTAITGAPVRAAPLSSLFSSCFVFGDSLSDTGNAFAFSSRLGSPLPPSPPYFDGRVSNGPVWNESIAAGFAVTGNFAFAAANATGDRSIPPVVVPGFGTQIGAFEVSVPLASLGARPLASVWFGANDLFLALEAGANVAGASLAGRVAALATGTGLARLDGGAFDDILLFNLPDLGRTPAYAGTPRAAVATAGTAAFNAELARQAAALRAGGLNVIEVDMAALFDDLLSNPPAGLNPAIPPCITGSVLTGITAICADTLSAGRLFYDSVHPTTGVHSLIAAAAVAAVDASVAPIPLPGALPLLVAALGGLVLVRRRA